MRKIVLLCSLSLAVLALPAAALDAPRGTPVDDEAESEDSEDSEDSDDEEPEEDDSDDEPEESEDPEG